MSTRAGEGPVGRAGVAAFDFDGTLVAGDSLLPFIRLVLGWRAVPALAAAAPATLRAYRGGRADGGGADGGGADGGGADGGGAEVGDGGGGGRDAAKAALLSRVFAGVPLARVQGHAQRFGELLAQRLEPEMVSRMAWHRSQGHRLVLVSASLALYLRPFAGAVGLDEVVATELEVGPDGILTGRILGANVRGPEKALRLRAVLGETPVELWAYGDSAGDREMLAMADHPMLVGRRPG